MRLLERDLVPDFLIRRQIRTLLAQRLCEEDKGSVEAQQRHLMQFIDEQANLRGLGNLEIVTADMNSFDTSRRFDRVVSVEMFEHMRNYQRLLKKIASWMKPAATLFVHIFTHNRFAYPFEVHDAS